MTPDNLVKIELREGQDVETPWAERVGPNQFRLDNIPFFAYGLSFNDVVQAVPPRNGDGIPVFTRIVRKGGHRTIRVILDPPADQAPSSQAVLDALVQRGCTYQGLHPGYIAIDIPPRLSLKSISDYLVKAAVQWEHADPTYEELHSRK